METSLAIFNFNTANLPFCDFDDTCYNFDFWNLFRKRIQVYLPQIVVFMSQRDNKEYNFHSSSLPELMNNLGYFALQHDQLNLNGSLLQTSVYTRNLEVISDGSDGHMQRSWLPFNKENTRGALCTRISFNREVTCLINLSLPEHIEEYQRFQIFNQTVKRFCDYQENVICAGSFNFQLNGKFSAREVFQGRDILRYDSFSQNNSLFNEGVSNSGPLFAPTAKLSPNRGIKLPFLTEKREVNLGKNHQVTENDFKPNGKENKICWCDRILYYSPNYGKIYCVQYERIDEPETEMRYLENAILYGLFLFRS